MKFHIGESGAVHGEFEYGKLDISSNPELGFRPVQLLISALAGCSGGVLQRILEKKRMNAESIEIVTDMERNEEEVNRVMKISLHYVVYGKNLDHTVVQKSLELAVKNCAMLQSVKAAIDIVESIEVRER